MSRVDWPRVDAALAELFDSAAIEVAVDEGLRLGDLRFRRTLRLLQAVAVTAVVLVTGAALMLQGSVHAEPESAPTPPPPSHALPVVQSVSPHAGSREGGQTVVVTGLHLAGAEKVLFGETGVSDLVSVSDHQVVVVSPPHAPEDVSVTVVADAGTSRAAPGATYRFLAAPPSTLPVLATISPDSGRPSGGTEVTITGTRVADATSVAFGEVQVEGSAFRDVTGTSITLLTPEHASGTVDVTVTTDAGTSGPLDFTYTRESPPSPTDETPVVEGVDPASGSVDGGEEVTITGTNLGDVTSVEFGGAKATITSQDTSTITVTTPEHEAGDVDVVVSSSAGESAESTASRYTYVPAVVPPPVVTGIEPGQGPSSGRQLVTIRGTGLASATSVTFGGNEVTEVGSSESSITLITPEHRPGLVEVTVTTQGGTSSVSRATSYLYVAAPTITRLDPVGACPNTAPPVVTITGSGFVGPGGSLVDAVRFGDRPATVTGGPTGGQIQVVAPPTPPGTLPVTVPVTVTTVGGTSGSLPFTYYDACVD